MQNEITWFQKLGSEQDPFAPNPARGDWFFETPALSSHINTLVNVAGNGEFIGLVKGEPGVGKTSLLNRLEERLRDRDNISFTRVTCSQGSGLIQALGLSSGLSDEELAYEPRKRLIDHLTRLRTAGQTVVAAIDDAHLLSPQDLALLIRIALSPNNESLINTILFAEADIEARLWLSAINDPLPLDRLYTLVLTPLSADQTTAYLEHRLQAAGLTQLAFSSAESGTIHRKSRGLPAAINTEASARLQRRTRSLWGGLKLPSRSVLYWLAGGTAAAALAGVAVWQGPRLLPLLQPEKSDATVALQESPAPVLPTTTTASLPLPPPESPAVEAPPLPTLRPQERPEPAETTAEPAETAPVVVAATSDNEPATTSVTPVTSVVVDEPPPVAAEPAPPVPEPAAEPVAVTTTAVSAEPSAALPVVVPPPIALSPPSLATDRAIPQPVTVEPEPPAAVKPPPALPAAAPTVPALPTATAAPVTPVRVPEPKPQVPPKPKVAKAAPPPVVTAAIAPPPTFHESRAVPEPVKETPRAVQLNDVRRDDWFRQRKPSEYVIQITGSSQEPALRDFIARQSFPSTPGYFRSRQKSEWYVLVLGPYNNEAQARAALNRLPYALKKNKPWVRSMASVHADMRLER